MSKKRKNKARTLRVWSEYAEKAIQVKKNLKKKEQVAEPKPVIRELEEIETVPEEEQNVVFKPNEGMSD